MLKELVEKGRVAFSDAALSWEDAVEQSCEVLIKQGAVEPSYPKDIIKMVKQYGPYIVIAPHIAIPHAQEGNGVNETALAFFKTTQPVQFPASDHGKPEDYQANLFFVLASCNNEEHLNNLMALSDQLSDEEFVSDLLKATTTEDLLKAEESYHQRPH